MALRILTYLPAAALALLTLGVRPAAAQAFYFMPEPTVPVAMPAVPSYVARVVDARPQHATLGLVTHSGAAQAATFREGVTSTLQGFFRRYAPAQPGAVPLVLRVTGLEIAEMPNSVSEGRFTENAAAGLVADFYAPQPDSSYQLVARFTQTHSQVAFDATSQHAANLGFLLLDAAVLGGSPTRWLTDGPRYPKASVLDPHPLFSDALPVLSPTVQPQPGFYQTITDFWLNQPREPGQPILEKHAYANIEWADDVEIKAYRRTDGRLVLADDAWGFCDGQDFYLRRGHNFYKLERRGADFYFYGGADDDPVFRKASSTRSASNATPFVGVIGGALAGAADAASPSGGRALLKLSLLTGEVRLAQSNSVAAAVVANRPTHLFIYRPRSEKGPTVRISLAEGQPAQALAAGDFLTFEPNSDQPLRVCLLPATGPATYLAVTPTAEAPTYLECRPTGPEPLRKVKDTAGAAALSKLVR